MSTILVTGASGFVGELRRPRTARGGHASWRSSARPDAGRLVLDRLPEADRARVEWRIGDVTRPDTLPGPSPASTRPSPRRIPRDRRGGEELRLVNTEGTRAVVAAMRTAGIKRLVHMGAMGVSDDPALHYASSKAKAEALVAASDLDWTILKPSLQFGPGDGFFNIIADLVRLSPGIVPVPGDGKSRSSRSASRTSR